MKAPYLLGFAYDLMALSWGVRGRGFKSRRTDHLKACFITGFLLFKACSKNRRPNSSSETSIYCNDGHVLKLAMFGELFV